MIAFNAVLLNPYAGGISTYMLNVLKNFEGLIPQEFLKIYLAEDQRRKYENIFKFPVTITPLNSSSSINRVLKENFYWPKQLKKDNIQLFHSPISYLPFRLKTKKIVTIHDLRVFRFPDTFKTLRRVFLKRAIKYSIHNADKIITISNFTKSEIVDLFSPDPTKISVIYEGIDIQKFKSKKETSDQIILKKYNLLKPYIFTVGHLEPRKNYLRLIKAYKSLPSEVQNDIHLVIGGRENFYYKPLQNFVFENELEDRVIFTKFISNEDLPILYRNALIFTFPSIYEGFGLPPLESLVSGVPVAASKVSSIPEILGESALYFDPLNSDDMADKIMKLIFDDDLRQSLLAKSQNISERYSWSRCAIDTYKVYQEFL